MAHPDGKVVSNEYQEECGCCCTVVEGIEAEAGPTISGVQMAPELQQATILVRRVIVDALQAGLRCNFLLLSSDLLRTLGALYAPDDYARVWCACVSLTVTLWSVPGSGVRTSTNGRAMLLGAVG